MAIVSSSRTEDLLCRTGAYRPARNAYQRIFNRGVLAGRRADRAFFGRFVPRGGLVFDVGANEGRLTEVFAELGASVIAVEPNPVLAERVRLRYGSAGVAVEAVALGACAGTASLRLGRDTAHSTLSDEWRRAVRPEDAAGRWGGTIAVPVTTLEALVGRFGRPDFVKIDVEGFEPEVLTGLRRPVPALSFEFQCAAPTIGRRSVAIVAELGGYTFNLTRGEHRALRSETWMTAGEVLAEMDAARRADPAGYGDVYARQLRR
jgi:FkbM family methyltransferase